MKAEELKKYAAKGMTYEAYVAYIHSQLEKGLTTDNNPDAGYLQTTEVCASRIDRLEKRLKVDEQVAEKLKNLDKKYHLIVITEGWCGDASQVMPVLSKMDKVSENFELKIVLREQNPELMDAYLYNGTKSIPRMIGLNAETGEELFVWGPRPKPLLELTAKFKADENYLKPDFLNDVQKWYNKDKGLTIQNEIVDQLK